MQSEAQRPALALNPNPSQVLASQVIGSVKAQPDSEVIFLNPNPKGPEPILGLSSHRHRRVRTSAAMVGLAISMGASDVLSLWNMKGAAAAETNTPETPVQDLNALENSGEQPSPVVAPSIQGQDANGEALAPLFSESSSNSQNSSLNLAVVPAAESSPVSSLSLQDYYPHELFSHRVNPQETLWSIAQRYGLDVATLASLNSLTVDMPLRVGQLVQFPIVLATKSLTAEPIATETIEEPAFQPIKVATAAPESTAPGPSTASDNLKGQVDTLADSQKLSADVTSSGSQDVVVELEIIPPPVTTTPDLPVAFLPSGSNITNSIQSPGAATPTDSATGSVDLSDLMPYRVQPGDTLDKIARTYQVSRSTLMAVNHLDNPNLIKVNQVLGVPQTQSSALDLALVSPSPEESDEGSVTVPTVPSLQGSGPGATPEVTVPSTVASVIDANNTPGVSYNPRNALGNDQSYQVRAGDTLAKIARSYNVSLGQLIQANNLPNPNLIRVSQNIVIPGGAAPTGWSDTAANSVQIAANTARLDLGIPQPEAPIVQTTAVNGGTSELRVNTAVIPTVPSLQAIVQDPIALPTPNALTPSREADLPNVAIAPSAVTSPYTPEEVLIPGATPAETPEATTGKAIYVNGLLEEVKALRQRYQSGQEVTASSSTPESTLAIESPSAPAQATAPQVAAPQVALASPTRSVPLTVTPPVVPSVSATIAPTPQVQATGGERVNPEFLAAQTGRSSTEDSPELLAAAPVGATAIGQTVSPGLPSLNADAYVPQADAVAGFIWPAHGVLTSGYGWRWGRMHKGIDIAGPVGTPIVAAASGVVITAGWNSGGYGNLVEIQHSDGSITLYAHNSRLLVRTGQYIQQGQQVAEMGSTGFSTGPHLHFEVHPGGSGAVNPIAYLPQS